MQKTTIPHAVAESVVRGFPDSILHVATPLAENIGELGFDAGAKQELLRAVAKHVADDDLQGYQVHWSYSGTSDA